MAHPYPPHPPPTRGLPVPSAGGGRRFLATTLDTAVFLTCLIAPLTRPDVGPVEVVVAVGAAFGVSFVNHVLLVVLFRASVGKLIVGLRVVRDTDGGRPGFWRAVARWLVGFGFVVVGVVLLLLEAEPGTADMCGLRVVRWRDFRLLRRWRRENPHRRF